MRILSAKHFTFFCDIWSYEVLFSEKNLSRLEKIIIVVWVIIFTYVYNYIDINNDRHSLMILIWFQIKLVSWTFPIYCNEEKKL